MMAELFTDRRADMPFDTILEQFKSLWSENNLSGNVSRRSEGIPYYPKMLLNQLRHE